MGINFFFFFTIVSLKISTNRKLKEKNSSSLISTTTYISRKTRKCIVKKPKLILRKNFILRL